MATLSAFSLDPIVHSLLVLSLGNHRLRVIISFIIGSRLASTCTWRELLLYFFGGCCKVTTLPSLTLMLCHSYVTRPSLRFDFFTVKEIRDFKK